MKPPNYATTEFTAIIARMFNNQSGGWLKKCEQQITSSLHTMGHFHKIKKRHGRRSFVSAERFELSTNGLKGRCSAVELRARQYSGVHSNMGNMHRQRKSRLYQDIYLCGGSHG